jgi:phosphohistidine phosphatase
MFNFNKLIMKTLLIIRHAKAESVFTLHDFERPLNDRGKNDAPEMADRLRIKKIKIDAFVSSPATRALQTAKYFAKAYNKETADIILITSLYHAAPEVFFEVVNDLDDAFERVAIFAHNPGITEFVNELEAGIRIDNMPTCGVFSVQSNASRWIDFKKSKKEYLFFDYPKNN